MCRKSSERTSIGLGVRGLSSYSLMDKVLSKCSTSLPLSSLPCEIKGWDGNDQKVSEGLRDSELCNPGLTPGTTHTSQPEWKMADMGNGS